MTNFSALNFKSFISFKGNPTKAEKTTEAKEATGVTLPPALKCDTFVKSAGPKETDYSDDDYDEEFEARQKERLQERLEQLDKAAQNLEALSLPELQNTLDIKFSLEYDAPNVEPSYETLADTIISKINRENITSKEAAEMLFFIVMSTRNTDDNEEEELSRIIDHISTLLYETGKENYQENFDTLQEAFKGMGAEFSGRIKTIESIRNKLPVKTPEAIKNGVDDISNMIPDICGYKLVTDGSDEQIEEIIEQLEKLLENGTYTLGLISSHGEKPYINKDKILDLYKKRGGGYILRPYPGFVGTNIILKNKDGKNLELQITGKEVNKVNVKEHEFYKLWTMDPKKRAEYFKNHNEIDVYGRYKDECYTFARDLELGTIKPGTEKPRLPEGLSEELRLI